MAKKEAALAEQRALQEAAAAKAKAEADAKAKAAAQRAAMAKKSTAVSSPAATSQATSRNSTNVRVQLGAFRSRSDANAHWVKVQQKFSSLIGGKSSYIEVVKLQDKGTFYRLQLVPYSNKADAKKVCDTLNKQKQACFVVVK